METLQAVKTWNVEQTDGKKVRVATIEQGLRKPSMCEGCSAPCCRGLFRPILDEEEFLSKKFPTMFIDVPKWLKEKAPRAEKIAVLAFTENKHCNYFNPVSARCTVWPECPKGCLAYDCREDTRPEIRKFARERIKE
jgi:Fe-S-cluster containining protein